MYHGSHLVVERCPHCIAARPTLTLLWNQGTQSHNGARKRFWACYQCSSCGGVTLACSPVDAGREITELWPAQTAVDEAVPARAREFLGQAINSLHAPSGAVMLTGSAVDAMLKAKNYKSGSLNARIIQAAADHVITQEMAAWAHDIRLDANDERHADESADLPSEADAEKAIEFARALAQFLFVLPARVERGRGSPPSG